MGPSGFGGAAPPRCDETRNRGHGPGLAELSKGNTQIVGEAPRGKQGRRSCGSPLTPVLAEYRGLEFAFTPDAWFNATQAAAKFGKRPVDWLKLPETKRYVSALVRWAKVTRSHFVRTQRGGRPGESGTWLAPKLAVRFAQWLDIDFAVWADGEIDRLIRGYQVRETVTLFAHRLALETRDASSRAKAAIGSRYMHERRRELPSIQRDRKALERAMQAALFGAETEGDGA